MDDAACRAAQGVPRLMLGINPHHNQIRTTGPRQPNDLDTRTTADRDYRRLSEWTRHLADGVFKEAPNAVLESLLPRSKIGIVALEFFPVVGQHVSERPGAPSPRASRLT